MHQTFAHILMEMAPKRFLLCLQTKKNCKNSNGFSDMSVKTTYCIFLSNFAFVSSPDSFVSL